MNERLIKSKAKEVFYWFNEISRIPRGSRNEQAISDFFVNFAKERNLECYQDKAKNVLIKKAANNGNKNSEALIIQGHMDMVCEKTKASKHDFLKDPIELVVDNNWLYAKDTTLGADDGMAVAMGLAILDDDNIKHGDIEVLFTVEEELAMKGAFSIDGNRFKGKYLLNIDGEIEGELYVACAGGMTIESKHNINWVKNKLSKLYDLEIFNLTGGHSGMKIEYSRGNAIKLLARLIFDLDCEIVAINSGRMHNVIPVAGSCKLYLSDEAKKELESRIALIKEEKHLSDPNMEIILKEIDNVDSDMVFDKKDQREIIDALVAIYDGVIYMDPIFKGLVQTSISNGILETSKKELRLVSLLRSSVRSCMDEIRQRLGIIMRNSSFSITDDGGYPAWEYKEESKLRDIAKEVFLKIYKNSPNIKTIHCGLECGILNLSLPDVDMISYGPTILDVHTVDEKADIESVERIWEFTKELVREIGEL